MDLWFDYIKYGWPILTGIAALVGLVTTIWLNSRYVSRADYAKHRQEAEDRHTEHQQEAARHAARIDMLEQHLREPPTRHDLSDGLTEIAERVAKVESTVGGIDKRVDREFGSIGKQLDTMNDYLRAVIEKALGK